MVPTYHLDSQRLRLQARTGALLRPSLVESLPHLPNQKTKMTNDTPVRDAAQLAAEEIQNYGFTDCGELMLTAAQIAQECGRLVVIIRKHFPSAPLPVSGEIPTPIDAHYESVKCDGCGNWASCCICDTTPRTDKESETNKRGGIGDWVHADFARQLERELATASVPLCIGQPIIQLLAKDGQWLSSDGRGLIAADCLFRKDPYEELATERAARERWQIENESHAAWIKTMNEIVGYNNDDGFHCIPSPHDLAKHLVVRAEAAEANMAELKRDKDRLDAVQSHFWEVAGNRFGQWIVLFSDPDGSELIAKEISIRAAIDAALASVPAEQ